MSTTATMRAATYEPGQNELVFQTIPVPTPGPRQLLFRTTEPMFSDTRTPDTQSNVQGITIGQLYAIWDAVPCVLAHFTATLPPVFDSIGIGKNGGYAEYVIANQVDLVPVPQGLAPEIACLASDSLLTAYNAVHNVAQLGPGTTKRVLIFGIGGLGHQAVQLAKSYGATVFACDIKPEARELALSLGAEQAFDLVQLTAAVAPTADAPFTVDIVIDFVANEQTFTLAKNVLKLDVVNLTTPGGLIVPVGFTADKLPVSALELIEWRSNVLSALYGSLDDMKACLDLLAQGVIKPIISTEPLENVNEILNGLKAGTITGRKVVLPNASA